MRIKLITVLAALLYVVSKALVVLLALLAYWLWK